MCLGGNSLIAGIADLLILYKLDLLIGMNDVGLIVDFLIIPPQHQISHLACAKRQLVGQSVTEMLHSSDSQVSNTSGPNRSTHKMCPHLKIKSNQMC